MARHTGEFLPPGSRYPSRRPVIETLPENVPLMNQCTKALTIELLTPKDRDVFEEELWPEFGRFSAHKDAVCEA
jgi:hypothetical protein